MKQEYVCPKVSIVCGESLMASLGDGGYGSATDLAAKAFDPWFEEWFYGSDEEEEQDVEQQTQLKAVSYNVLER